MLEAILLLFLTLFAIFGVSALAYWMVLLPLKDEIKELKKELKRQNNKPIPAILPANVLPSQEDLPDSAWDIGDYGDADKVTAEDVDEEMSELEKSTKEADAAWQELESLKHGKRQPVIYGG